MWMIAVCCTRRASICAARDDPLRDFIPAAPLHGEQRYKPFCARIRGCKGEGSALGDEGSRFPRRAASLKGMLSSASQADGEVTRQKRPTDADVPGRGE